MVEQYRQELPLKNKYIEGVDKCTLPVGSGGRPLDDDDDDAPSTSNGTVLLPRLGALLLCCRLFPIGVITLSRRRGIDGALERSTRGWAGRGGFLCGVTLAGGCLACAATASGRVRFSSLTGIWLVSPSDLSDIPSLCCRGDETL